MLLDEPTSGLDSHTSLRIAKILRNETYRGMSVLATIHQPSSELFFLFDRVILLSEGFTIYSGPPNKVE
jgi:ABC-type multidrug transport system ATPase subunit